MSEKDGKRVLSPAEKAEADSLTNKQWLDTIGIVLLPISG